MRQILARSSGWPPEKCEEFLNSRPIRRKRLIFPADRLAETLAELSQFGVPCGSVQLEFLIPPQWEEKFVQAVTEINGGRLPLELAVGAQSIDAS